MRRSIWDLSSADAILPHENRAKGAGARARRHLHFFIVNQVHPSVTRSTTRLTPSAETAGRP